MYPGLFHPIGTKSQKQKQALNQIETEIETNSQNKQINKVIYLIFIKSNVLPEIASDLRFNCLFVYYDYNYYRKKEEKVHDPYFFFLPFFFLFLLF